MSQIKDHESTGTPAEAPAPVPARPRASILMVDDQPARLLTYEAILSGVGVRCVRALSGTEALEKLLAEEFAVLLLDVEMPGMDGFELARLVREHPRMERIPIIFITGVHVSVLDQLRGYEVGAIDYIQIPVVPEILRSKVALLVELHLKRSELKALNQSLQEARARSAAEHAQAFAQQEAELLAAYNHPDELIVMLQAERSADGTVVDWIYRSANANTLRLLGRSRESLIGQRLSEVLADRAARLATLCLQVCTTGKPVRYEADFGGRTFLITLFCHGPDRVVSSGLDVTERKRTDQRLHESEQRFRELANNIDQFAWTCDQFGHAIWYNDRWYQYTGSTFEDMQGEGWKSLHHPEHLGRVSASLAKSMSAGTTWEETFPLRGKDGQFRWFLTRAVPIRDEAGRIQRWFGTNTDVTELRELQEALSEKDRRKDEFLAILAHELRNPIAPIRNAAEALSRLLKSDERALTLVGMIQRQSIHLSRVVDDLLDVARIAQGRIELRQSTLPMSSCIAMAVETAQPLIRAREHRLTIESSSDSLLVSADKVRLEQCIANLLTNAAKYTDPGGEIRIRCYRDGDRALLEVSDSGVGIPAEFMPRIFDLFAQSKRSLDRSQGGLGIGLSLCKQLIELHCGQISIRSPGPGRGTTVTIALPLAQPQ